MNKFSKHIKKVVAFARKAMLFYILLLIFNNQTKAQDSAYNYHHNIGLFPVYEGLILKYEHKLNTKKSKSLRGALTLKVQDGYSIVFQTDKYNEQKLAFQFRNYKKKENAFTGFYHGPCLQVKHFEGKYGPSRGTFIGTPVKINKKSLGLGYTIGTQFMTKSGVNFELGWVLYYQFADSRDVIFRDFIFDFNIPYNPYKSGINNQLTFGIGMAF